MVSTSAGMRCPDCAYVSGYAPLSSTVETRSMGMAAFAGILTGLAGAYTTVLLALAFPFLPILGAPLYGRLVADAIKSFSGESKDSTPAAIGVGSIMLGSLIAFGIHGGHHGAHVIMSTFTQAMAGLAIGLSVVVCYQRLKQRSS
jgi:hypothetical protein